MALFNTINIASSGLTVQRLRKDVIADNIANVNTTRTNEGGAFRRSRVIVRPRVEAPYYRSPRPFLPQPLDNGVGRGVRVVSVEKDYQSDLRLVYDPTHPDAILTGEKAGYVEMPNVNIVEEMVDLISASRSYEANVAVIDNASNMFQQALQIGR